MERYCGRDGYSFIFFGGGRFFFFWLKGLSVVVHFHFLGGFFFFWLKGLSVIVHSKLHFFPNPQIFSIFKENFTVITYLYNSSVGNIIFLEK